MRQKKGFQIIFIFAAAMMFFQTMTGNVSAGDTRGYIPAPPDTFGVLFYYLHTSGFERYADGDKISEDFNLQSNVQIFRPVYYSQLGTMPVTLQALIPFGDKTIDGAAIGNRSFSSSGLADPTILAGIWPISDPATKTWLAVSEWFRFPVGEYDKDKTLNMGDNQWAFKTEIGFVKGFGDFYLELSPCVEFYTDNDEYSSAGLTLEKDPLFIMETHLSYDVNKSVLVSLDHYYKKGAETTVADISKNDETDTHSLQFTLGLTPAPKQKLLLQYLEDISVENGSKTSKFGARYTYIF